MNRYLVRPCLNFGTDEVLLGMIKHKHLITHMNRINLNWDNPQDVSTKTKDA